MSASAEEKGKQKVNMDSLNRQNCSRSWMRFGVFLFLCITGPSARGENIIADHTIVSNYCYIPQEYIDKVKCMWLDVPGESHSYGYRRGCELLEMSNSLFQVNVIDSGTPEGPTNTYLRVSRATWGDVSSGSGWIYGYGEEDWFTSTTAIQRTKAHITCAKTNSREIAAIGGSVLNLQQKGRSW